MQNGTVVKKNEKGFGFIKIDGAADGDKDLFFHTTHPLYTATQFALFTSLASVPRAFINASTGFLVEQLGWFSFFLLCTLLALPGMALLLKVAPWREGEDRYL